MNIEETLSSLKKKIDSINTKKIENATKLQALEQEKLKLLEECQKLGVDPAQLETIVINEETKLQEEINSFETQVAKVYGQITNF